MGKTKRKLSSEKQDSFKPKLDIKSITVETKQRILEKKVSRFSLYGYSERFKNPKTGGKNHAKEV